MLAKRGWLRARSCAHAFARRAPLAGERRSARLRDPHSGGSRRGSRAGEFARTDGGNNFHAGRGDVIDRLAEHLAHHAVAVRRAGAGYLLMILRLISTIRLVNAAGLLNTTGWPAVPVAVMGMRRHIAGVVTRIR